ncbi:MAG: tRNA 4-thiouridine(8) synthase ThiI [Spirochaetales bacterium]|nr:tRNA 4-thiouridine(8) synthase ThiI [Spirochaetales bacterium]
MFFLIRVGEISLKGGNRGYFEDKLVRNIKRRLRPFKPKLTLSKGRVLLEIQDAAENASMGVLSTTFGIVGYAKATVAEKRIDDVRTAVFHEVECFLETRGQGTFKIAARRSDKSFPLTSHEIAEAIGDDIRARFPEMTVDVHHPDLVVHVEIRDRAYVYGNGAGGPGGLPVGVAGRGILLLSGGIDSPVSGYLMAKRGLAIEAVYFHTYPYTAEEALGKVKTLVEKLSGPCCGLNLYVVHFTEVALAIRRGAPRPQTTLLMRAAMMDCASRIGGLRGALCLVTGESLSQVASQTAQSMRFTGSTSRLPVFRPLIALDKEEIVTTAKKIGTYETSILPFEDCCTVFSPEKPLIRPDFALMQHSYAGLGLDGPVSASIAGMERFWYPPA